MIICAKKLTDAVVILVVVSNGLVGALIDKGCKFCCEFLEAQVDRHPDR